MKEEMDQWQIWSHNKTSSLVGNDIGIKDYILGQELGQVPKCDISTALNAAKVPRAGRLAWGVRREATGVSLWMAVMGVQARFGTEQEAEELGDPWGNEQMAQWLKFLPTVSWFRIHRPVGRAHKEAYRYTFRLILLQDSMYTYKCIMMADDCSGQAVRWRWRWFILFTNSLKAHVNTAINNASYNQHTLSVIPSAGGSALPHGSKRFSVASTGESSSHFLSHTTTAGNSIHTATYTHI